jgi:SH3-like domain-containing protein|tara:strand:- start:1697 stop:2143 length:447 start_codon:yes stop_codon:yes gene_type:complete
MIKKIFLIFIFILTLTNLLSAEEYFSILKYNNVNLRQGPSKNYPVKIFYKKKYLPVIVQDRSDNFRKIRDHEDNTGWVHVSQLSQKKAALVSDDQVVVFKNSTVFSEPLVILERGRLCLVSKCKERWCKIRVEKYSGWVKRKSLWGNL